MTSTSSIDLINGGLDVQSIVDNLITAESQPITRMQNRTTSMQSKIKAYQTLNTKLSTLLDKVNLLVSGDSDSLTVPSAFQDRLAQSMFATRKASSSDESVLTVTPSKGNASGTYKITVSGLASAKTMASANFASTDTATTGTGTLVFQVGTDDPVSITIDSTNNTLEGISQEINAAGAGVTASVINDGSGTPYRLLVTSNETGTANAFTVTDNLTGGPGLGLTQTAAASDAQLLVNNIAITRSSNSISNVIDGVTLDLKEKSDSPVTVTVGKDTDAIVSAIKDFVSAYNDINTYIASQSTYDSTTKTAGVLSGDATLRSAQRQLQSILTQGVTNDVTDLFLVGQVGLSFGNDGTLSLNETKLRDQLSSNPSGVAGLFLGNGDPGTPEQVTFTDDRAALADKSYTTQAGTYAIQVTALAQQASLTNSRTLDSLSQDETLTISYQGNSATVNLLRNDTLDSVLTKISGAFTANSWAVSAAEDAGRIRITTNGYGSAESLSVVSNQADAPGSTGFGTVPSSSTGSDIAGTINGHVATGSGLTLTGADGNPEEGLSVTLAQSTTGSYGSVTYTTATQPAEGNSILVNLRAALKNITDPLSGPIQSATDGLTSSIKSLNDQIKAYQARLEVRRELLTNEYSQADIALKQMSVLLASLNSQLSSLSS
jgi:flagellar hook-associated protein 2